MKTCEECGSESGVYALCDGCHQAWQSQSIGRLPYFKEMGVENPIDPKGSTAHVRDIKNRRYDKKSDTTFYYQKPKTYFFPQGGSK